MSHLNFSQQHNIFEAAGVQPVTVIGAGSVGSQVVSMLAKIGVTAITVHDGDAIESHNVPMSAYGVDDLGVMKVLALRDLVKAQSDVKITAVPRMYEGGPLSNAVVACVDSMEARQLIWREVLKSSVNILIDTRVSAELVSVFAIDPGDPEDIEYYEYFLRYPSKEAIRPMCGLHGIVYVGAVAAASVCANLTNWWKKSRKVRHFKMLVGELECIED
jgi:molybdopterin/thiamine biosynthesis adenylyltransferase